MADDGRGGAASTLHAGAVAVEGGQERDAAYALPEPTTADAGGDTIARRTRTKFSLVDVPIDTLESCLPDVAEPILGDDEQDNEYQRFLSSLLPHEQENLSFLDEEDEEYEPEEEDEEEDEEDADSVAVANSRDRVTVKISKRELTGLLWDSTQLGLPLPAPDALPFFSGAVLDGGVLAPKSSEVAGGDDASVPLTAANPLGSTQGRIPTPAWFPRRSNDSAAAAPPPVQELHGSISPEQCIHLASQMHKHLQLLLQSFHMFAAAPVAEDESSETATEEEAERLRLRKREAMQECKKMMEELEARGEQAQQFKGELRAKLSSSGAAPGAQEDPGASRRVTRSVTAAHAAVSHPSMFELVGSQSLDELTNKLAASCTLHDRNRAIQGQMLEVDKHLLGAKKRNRKKPFTHAEDNLLAHGAKRFALHPDMWAQIAKHFLPGKSAAVIERRYRYLASNKSGMSAVKEYHSQFPKKRDTSWILEEDLRVARGMIEYHNDKRRFARVGMYHLPHRTRLEIRRRWKRLRLEWYETIAEQTPSIDDASIDFAVLLKDLLEDKLRAQVKQQSLELVENDADSDSATKDEGGESATDDAPPSKRYLKRLNSSVCLSKNLHPALFFTSWASSNPAILINKTCQHNLPSFVEELAMKQQEQTSEATPSATPSSTMAAESQDVSQSAADPDLSAPPSLTGDGAAAGVEPAIELPDDSEVARLAHAFLAAGGSWVESLISKEPPPVREVEFIESEPSTANTSAVMEDEEDDDSDYEHDELVSSDAERDSDSEEFEQLELSDDDDDDDDEEEDEGDEEEEDDDDFDYEELGISVDDDDDDEEEEEEEGSEDPNDSMSTVARTAWRPPSPLLLSQRVTAPRANGTTSTSATQLHPSKQQSPSRLHVRHTLRLQNLVNPDNERTKRALEALERRIVGKSLKNVLVKPPAARPAGKRRIGLTEATQDKRTLGSQPPAENSTLRVRRLPSSSSQADAGLFGSDLGTDTVLGTSIGGGDFNANDFECEELLDGSSDEEEENRELSASADSGVAPSPPASSISGLEQELWRPNKKIKLLRSAACSSCNRSDSCSCSSRRVEQLAPVAHAGRRRR